MILKSILPFVAIALFLLALLVRNKAFLKRKRLREEAGEGVFPLEFEKIAGALGWIFIAWYCFLEASDYIAQGEHFDASLAFIFLAFSLLLAFLLVKTREKEDLFFTITKIALITSIFYFPISEFSFLGDSLIYITAKITTTMLNFFNPGSVYMDYPPSFIYSTFTSFDVEIVLACTAIQSMVLFTGLVFGVNAPMRRKLKAFLVSVPVIYGLNIVRNVFVITAYFEQWFAYPSWQWLLQWFVRLPPTQSFDIAHGVLARIGAMIALIAIAYMVFVILPEALDVVEDFVQFIFKPIKRNKKVRL